jgi:hypothetical protein
MLPNWLRLIIVILLTLLVINLFLNFPKKGIYENINQPVAVLEQNKTYTCIVDKVESCHLFCYEMNTATLLKLKPDKCDTLKGLKRGQKISFRVENFPYYNDGSIPVVLLSGRE